MKNIAKTPIFATLRHAFRAALAAEQRGSNDTDALLQQHAENHWSRRQFLRDMGKMAALGALLPKQAFPFFGQIKPRIVIVGAGLAGLNALHTLKKAGLEATIYEASGRTSGRMMTVQKAMGEGTYTEFGGEFVDTNHADMWALAKELELELIDFAQASETDNLTKEAYFFGGKHRKLTELAQAFRPFVKQLKADIKRLPEDIDYQTKDLFAKKMDKMSISEYLERIGMNGWIKSYIEAAYESEYGRDCAEQSSLNLLLLIAPDINETIEIFGDSDERYKVRGGNQRIPYALAQKYTNHIELNRTLVAISRAQTGEYRLQFSGLSEAVKADCVIMAIPNTKLRQVDIRLTMPQIKWDNINQLGYGTNSKLMLGMKTHFWRNQGYTGLAYADNGMPNGWDNAQLQTADADTAGLSILFGGKSGVALGKGTIATQVEKYLPKWEQIYKGATQQYNGKSARMIWSNYEHNLGSYICYTVGQYTSIGGAEDKNVGRLYFAGEHCGGDFAGYMNGAAYSGRVAAEALIKTLD
jgi:monoamine oxidase